MRSIVVCLILIVLISCTYQHGVDVEIDAVSTPSHESDNFISFVRYWYIINNNSDTPVSIHYSQIDKIYDPGVEGLEPANIPVFSNVFLLFQKDTIWGGYGWRFEPYDTTVRRSTHYKGFFELDWMLLSQLYETKYENLYTKEKDFSLDVVKDGLLCVVIGDSVYKVRNKKSIEYMPDGIEE